MGKKFGEGFVIPKLLNDLSVEEAKAVSQASPTVKQIRMELIDGFQWHTYKVLDNADMDELVESIKLQGVQEPVLVRPKGDRYELISGHRRKRACEILGMTHIPAIVRHMTDDEAILSMVDANLRREKILPSEKAFSYKFKLEAMKRQGKRTDLTLSQLGTKLDRSSDVITAETGDSRNQIHRYIRLTNLIPELLDLVDEEKISFISGVELSYLPENEQESLLKIIKEKDIVPSLKQAEALKKVSKDGSLTDNAMIQILIPKEEKDDSASAEIMELLDFVQDGGPFDSAIKTTRKHCSSPLPESGGEPVEFKVTESKPKDAAELEDTLTDFQARRIASRFRNSIDMIYTYLLKTKGEAYASEFSEQCVKISALMNEAGL